MSYNQSKGEKNEYQYRKTGRSRNSANNNQRSNFQGSTGGGKGGGGNAPPPQSSSSLNSNRSFNKRSGNNGQGGGQSWVKVSNSYSEVNNTSSVARPGQNGAHVQPPLSGISDGPAPGVVAKPTTNPPAPRSARPAPKAPSSQSTTGIADSVAPSTPAKADMPKSVQLQFGSISPGVVNGMQIPAHTSSAPPNLDEQKHDQARHDSVRAAPTMPISSGSKQQPLPKDPGSNQQSVTGEPHAASSHARREVHAHVPPASGTRVSQKPSVLPIPGIPMSVPFQSQVSVPFGGSISHIQSQGISTTSVPMPIPLLVESAGQMPQQVFVPTHPLQTQEIIPQGPNLNFPTPIGHQMPPPIGNMGRGVSPQFPQQRAGKFGALRKDVKITHPITHEKLKLDRRMDLYMDSVSSGPRSQPNAPPQSQPVPTFTPPHFNYYPPMQTNSYYFSSPQSAVPLPNTQMTTGPQATRYNYFVGQGPPTVTYKNPASLKSLPSAKNLPSAEASNIEHAHHPQTISVSTPSPYVQFTVKPAAVSTGTSSVTRSTPVIEKVESPKLLGAPKEGSTLQSHSAIASAAVSPPRLSTSTSSSATASLSEESAPVMTGPEGRPKEVIKRSESFKDRQKKRGKKDTRNAQFQNKEDPSVSVSKDKTTSETNRGNSNTAKVKKKLKDILKAADARGNNNTAKVKKKLKYILKAADAAGSTSDGNSVEGHAKLGTSGKTLVPSARALPDSSDSASNDIQNQDGDISCIASKETDLHSEGTILDNLDVSEHSKQDLGEVQPKPECRTVEDNTELNEGTKDSSNNLELLSEPTSEFSEGNRQMGVDCDVKDTTAGKETVSVGSEQKSEGVDHCNSEVESITDNLVKSSDLVDAQTAPSSSDSSTSSHDDKTSNDSSRICNNHRDSQDPHADLTTVSSDVSLMDETKILESISCDLISTSVSVSKDKTTSETNRGKSNTGKVKKKRKDILKALDAAGSTSDLYMAYKGPEEKQENLATAESADNSSSLDSKQAPAIDKEKDTTTAEEDGQTKAEPDDWEDAADMSIPKLKPSGNQTEDGKNSKKYSRDFLLTLSEQCTVLPVGFKIESDIAEALMSVQVGIFHLVEREMYSKEGNKPKKPQSRPKELRIVRRKGEKKDTGNAQFQNKEDPSPRLSRDVKKGSDIMQSPPSGMVESSSSFVSSPLQGLKHAKPNSSLNDGNSVEGYASLGTSGKTLLPSVRPLPDPFVSASNDIQNQDGNISCIASKETDLHSEGTILANLDVSEHSKQDMGEVRPKRECRTVVENTELIEGTKDSSNNLEMLSEPTCSEFSEGNRQMGVDCDVKYTTAGKATGSVGSEQKSEGVDHCNSEVESITGNLANSSDSVDAQTAPSSSDSSTSSLDDKTSIGSSSICNNHMDSQYPHSDLTIVPSDVSLKDEIKILESSCDDLISTSVSVSKGKTTSVTNRRKSNTAKVKKKRKDIFKASEAAGSTSDLYMAYKGLEEKQENLATSENANADNSSGLDSKQSPADDKEKDTTTAVEDGQTKAEPDDWEDVVDMSTLKLNPSGNETEDGKNSKKYSRDFLLTLSEQCTVLLAGFKIGSDIAEALMSVQVGISHLVEREMYSKEGIMPKKPQSNIFMSSFETMGKLFKKLPHKQLHHVNLLRAIGETGFIGFYNSMLTRKTSTTKMNHQIVRKAIFSISKLYSKEEDAFKIGNSYVKFTINDVAVIFGLNATGKKISMEKSKDKHNTTDFVKDHFPDANDLTMNLVKMRIIKLLDEEVQRHRDVALLMVIYMMITIFFASSHQRVAWSHISYLDNLKAMKSVNWPHAIHTNLIEKLRKSLKKEGSILCGCNIALLYWFCEHTNFTTKIKNSENEFPRTGRWNIKDLVNKMEKCPTLNWDNMEVHQELLDLSEQEKSLFVARVEEESVVPQKVVVEEEYGPNNLAVAYEKLKLENEELITMNAQLKDENEQLQKKLFEKDVEVNNDDNINKDSDEKDMKRILRRMRTL